MSDERHPRDRGLRALAGGRRLSTSCSDVNVVVSHVDDAPFPIDAMALEEDTWLALSAGLDTVISAPHPVRVITQVWKAQPREPGTVVVQPGRPTRLLAIVHDLNREPSWTKEWVERALSEVLRAAVELECESLALPLLGTKHGDLPPLEFVRMLPGALSRAVRPARDAPYLRRIWLVRDGESGAEIVKVLAGEDTA